MIEAARRLLPRLDTRSRVASYVTSLAVVALATAVAFLMEPRFQTTDLALVYLLGTTYAGVRLGRGPSLLVATLGVAAFDFCFVAPRYTFAVHDLDYVPTFGAMLAVGLIVSTLAAQARERAEAARAHASWSATLQAIAQELAHARDVAAIAAATVRQIEATLGGRATVLVSREGRIAAVAHGSDATSDDAELAAARWVLDHGQPAGPGTDALPDSARLYLPLATGARVVGVLGYSAPDAVPLADPQKREMLAALSQQAAGALERALLAEETQQVELRARAEELRTSLLSSVSHDLRTPLAAIVGSATTLLGEAGEIGPAQRADLVRNIYEEAQRLTRLVSNLLAMTRIESAQVAPEKEWVPLEEVVGAALTRLGERLAGRPIGVRIPASVPLVSIDPVLIEQCFFNLVENALLHTPPGTPIEVEAALDEGAVVIDVRDRGPGLPPDARARLFTKFFRGPNAPSGGSGLGLAICRGMVAAHGGSIEAFGRPGGGSVFRVRLPIAGQAPSVPAEPLGSNDAHR